MKDGGRGPSFFYYLPAGFKIKLWVRVVIINMNLHLRIIQQGTKNPDSFRRMGIYNHQKPDLVQRNILNSGECQRRALLFQKNFHQTLCGSRKDHVGLWIQYLSCHHRGQAIKVCVQMCCDNLH